MNFELIKAAMNGGNEAEFEQAFSSLAYIYLKDKAPKLLDHMVGFQLVDRNDDNTKAFAIFGFKLGSQWLYGPVFFLNGQLKGHELLYMKNNDSFVPMSEQWVNYLMSRRPHILGSPSAQTLGELGGRYPDVQAMSRMSISQHAKRASDNSWLKPFLPVAAAFKRNLACSLYKVAQDSTLDQSAVATAPWSAGLAAVAEKCALDAVLVQEPVLLVEAAKIASVVPAVKRAFNQFYGADCFQRWAKQVQTEKEAAAPDLLSSLKPVSTEKEAVRLYVYEQVVISPVAELDDDDMEHLQKKRVLIKDDRTDEQRSHVYAVDSTLEMSSPTESGMYDVLMHNGDMVKALVLLSPVGPKGRYRYSYVVKPEGSKKDYVCESPDKIFVQQGEAVHETWSSWFNGLPDKELRVGGKYIAVGPSRQASCVFTVTDSGDNCWTADFDSPSGDFDAWGHTEDYISNYGVQVTRVKGGSFWSRVNNFGIPQSFKLLELDYIAPPEDSSCCVQPVHRCDFALGTLRNAREVLNVKTAGLRVVSDGLNVQVRSKQGSVNGSRLDALWHLVKEHHMGEELARSILKEADSKRRVDYRIVYPAAEKIAAPNSSVLAGGPSAELRFGQLDPRGSEQYGPRTSAVLQEPGDMAYVLQQLSSSYNDPNVWNNWQNYQAEDFQSVSNAAQQAASTGQKEIFDVGMLSSMLKSVRKDSLVEKHLGTLMEAIDALGRLLMNFYWHEEDFADRYGQGDLPELEDGLRNAFETLGDITLFLKEKTIESPMDVGELDLDDIARN